MPTKTISTYAAAGYTLSATFDTLTITSTGGVGGIGLYAANLATVTNAGTITATADATGFSYGLGVLLRAGGSLTNTGEIDVTTAGSNSTAVEAKYGPGYVNNSSLIDSNAGWGIALLSGGGITNRASGVIEGGERGVFLYGSGSIINAGTITGATYGGVHLYNGVLTNNAAGLIQGVAYGAQLGARPDYGLSTNATITNAGSIVATGVTGVGVMLTGIDTFTNSAGGVIQGNFGVKTAYNYSATATIINAGSIAGGVYLVGEGSVTNSGGGVITGEFGVFANELATVVNAGLIEAPEGVGLVLNLGGHVTNAAGGVIYGYNGGITLGAIGTITNAGTIEGSVTLGAGGRVTNSAGGLVSGGVQIDLAGTVTNAGVIDATNREGVYLLADNSSLTNSGTIAVISSNFAAVHFYGDGRVTNNAGGIFQGYTGLVAQAAMTLVNAGVIMASGQQGVAFDGGGRLTNEAGGSIKGVTHGVQLQLAAGTVSNAGLIQATKGDGLDMKAGGAVTNSAGGQIVGSTYGVVVSGAASTVVNKSGGLIKGHIGLGVVSVAATVTNFGAIASSAGANGVAVKFTNAADRLVAEAGSAFTGTVAGGGGTLELANGLGILTGLGGAAAKLSGAEAMTFSGFSQVAIDAGASWTLTGANSRAAGQSLTSAGTLIVGGTLSGAGTLAIAGGATSINAGTKLTIAHVTQNGGTVTVGASLTYAGGWAQTAGAVQVGAGVTLTFSAAGDVFGGSFGGAGTVVLNGGSDRLAGTTISKAHLTITGATVTLAGTLANSGVIAATTTQLLVDAAGTTLRGGGQLTLTNSATNKVGAAGAGAVLTNFDNLIQGGGQLGGGTLGLVNQAAGRITGNAATALVIDTGAGTVSNAGTITSGAGGGVEIKSAVANTGLLVAIGGTLTLDKAVTGTGSAHINGGTLVATGAFSENVTFTSTTGTLKLAHSQTYVGKITGLSHAGGTNLDLVDIGFVSTSEATFKGTKSGGTLTVTDGTHTAKITLVGDYTAVGFTASSDGHGGTTIVDPVVQHFIAAVAGTPRAAGSSAAGQWAPQAAAAVLSSPRSSAP